jgi:hypothetical protein
LASLYLAARAAALAGNYCEKKQEIHSGPQNGSKERVIVVGATGRDSYV